MLQLTFVCVGPHRRVPPPVIGLAAPPQVPVISGFPLAARGVTTAAVVVAAGALADALAVRVQLGGGFVGLIAALTLAGTRSEERRVGKECICRWAAGDYVKK